MLMTAVVDTRIISMSGRTFFIKANEQKDIPHEFAKEAMAAGAFPVDVKAYKIAEEKKVPVKNDVSYDTPQKLEEAILKVLRQMKTMNNRNEFAGTGRPKLDAVRAKVGVGDIDQRQLNVLWEKLKRGDNNAVAG